MVAPTISINASNALSGVTLYFETDYEGKGWKGRDF